MLPGGHDVEVVGESHYDEALDGICGGRTEDGHDQACVATLIHEPDNPWDSNAVGVWIEGRKVGHLSRQTAVAFQPVAQALAGRSATVAAVIRGGWDRPGSRGNYGVTLDMGTPEICVRAIEAATDEVPPEGGRR